MAKECGHVNYLVEHLLISLFIAYCLVLSPMCQLTLLVAIIDGFAPLGINCAHSAVPAWPVDHCKRGWHVSQENYKVEDIPQTHSYTAYLVLGTAFKSSQFMSNSILSLIMHMNLPNKGLSQSINPGPLHTFVSMQLTR
jgi:hypothetical protein